MMELRKMLKVEIRLPGGKKRSGKTLAKIILEKCQQEQVLGAVVLRSIYGYGEHEYQTHVIRGLAELPVLIEIVDEPQVILRILPELKEIVQEEGLITIEEVLAA